MLKYFAEILDTLEYILKNTTTLRQACILIIVLLTVNVTIFTNVVILIIYMEKATIIRIIDDHF